MSDKPSKKTLGSAKTDVFKSDLLLLDGLAGNDRITGGSTSQSIYGGSGNDMLQGAGGNDILWGDGSSTSVAFVVGKDSFVFEKTLLANGLDTVMDFGIAGHKTAGLLQVGSYMADTLDLSHVKFTGLTTSSSEQDDDGEDEVDDDEGDDEGDDDFHITAANVNDYVSVKGGDLYIDTDGLGAGQAQVWAHLSGVSGGDLLNLKLDDLTVQIEAKNALASITGNSSGAVTEDGNPLASGILSVADTDRAENAFQAARANDLLGTYGSYSFNKTSGEWAFLLNNAAAQTLQAGESVDQTLTVTSLDGSATQTIKVTVQGTQDTAVISGAATGTVAEEGTLSASGALSVSDADHDQNSFQVLSSEALKGRYGDFSFDEASGAWAYTLNNTLAQPLGAGESFNEQLSVKSLDGTATQTITVTVNGAAELVTTALPKAINAANAFLPDLPLYDGDITVNWIGNVPALLIEGKADTSTTGLSSWDMVVLDRATVANLQGMEWTINGKKALGTADVSTWTTESALTNALKWFGAATKTNVDFNGDGTVNLGDFESPSPLSGAFTSLSSEVASLQTEFAGQVVVYFDGATFAAGQTVELIGTYQGTSVAHTILAT